MKDSPEKSLRWLTLAVLVPLVLLGVLAWLGTRAQVSAAWSSARNEAERLAPLLAKEGAADLQASMKKIPRYPDPPVPGVSSEMDGVLDEEDLQALMALRDDPGAGVSPAGLPRSVLAALRIYQLEPDRQTGEFLAELLTRRFPSILTEKALSVVSAPELVRRSWQEGEMVRSLAATVADGEGGWLADPDGKSRYFVRTTDGMLEYAVLGETRGSGNTLPAWAAPFFYIGTTDKPLLASAAVPLGTDLWLGISPRSQALEAGARQQARWTLGLLACAVLVSVGALVLIHRTVERERRLNAMKSDFVASVSHELRAPVASVRLMADALVAGKIEQRTVAEFHGLISREGARLSTLIDNVLDFARIEQGRKQWHFEHADLAALVAETLSVMEPLALEKGIVLEADKSPVAVDAQVDPVAIQQALVNLLDNSIKFSPRGSRVEIRLSTDGDRSAWEISVTDQGAGIPKAEQQRVFDKFYRLGSELRRETQGTGIGLSLVKAIAEAHGGTVRLVSTHGSGSTFTLSAPHAPPTQFK